jgi:two-component system KDP operon response regulator KdpE
MTTRAAHILVVDDEPSIFRVLERNLAAHGFSVRVAETGRKALTAFEESRPDLVLLDLGLPDIDGTEVVRTLRKQGDVPVIILSVRGSESEKVRALDLGADDYLVKPFGIGELLARVRVALRHASSQRTEPDPVFRDRDLEVDTVRRIVRRGGAEVHLTPTEFDLLHQFLSHPDRVLTDRMLLQEVWGAEYGSEAHYLHVYIARLRKKIESDPRHPLHIKTEPGVGYRLVTEP